MSPDAYVDKINIALKSNKTSGAYVMKREDFLNIEVFVNRKSTVDRLAYIRPTENKVFQRATQIVMHKGYPQGYILKDNFNQSDSEGKPIPVNPPETAKDKYNLSRVQLEPKYEHERRIDPMKMKDLLDLKDYMGPNGNWILTFHERWKQLNSQSPKDIQLENASPEQEEPEPEDLDRIFERVSVERL